MAERNVDKREVNYYKQEMGHAWVEIIECHELWHMINSDFCT